MRFSALALVFILAACVQAARFPSYESVQVYELPSSLVEWQSGQLTNPGLKDSIDDAQFLGSSVYSDLEALAVDASLHKKKKGPIHIASRILVKPELHSSFIHNFWIFRERSEKNKGIIHLSLNKVSGDNIVWSLYTVYEDVHALFEHMRSDALREFGSFITYSNIAVEYKLLIKIGGGHHSKNDGKDVGMFEPNMLGSTAAAAADLTEKSDEENKKGGGGKGRARPLKLITAYIVPPGEGCDFVREWEKAEKAVGKAKGNLAFGLMKPADDNVLFVGFSAWKSYEDFFDAAESRAVRDWLEFLGDKGVVAVTRKLYTVPPHHPRA